MKPSKPTPQPVHREMNMTQGLIGQSTRNSRRDTIGNYTTSYIIDMGMRRSEELSAKHGTECIRNVCHSPTTTVRGWCVLCSRKLHRKPQLQPEVETRAAISHQPPNDPNMMVHINLKRPAEVKSTGTRRSPDETVEHDLEGQPPC